MKKQLTLFWSFALLTASLGAAQWKAPGEAILPEANINGRLKTQARWLWTHKKHPRNKGAIWLRSVFTLNEPVKKASFYAWLDNKGSCYVNGRIISPRPPQVKFRKAKVNLYNITRALKKGINVLAFHITNDWNFDGGVILRGEIELQSGKKIPLVSTAENFKYADQEEKGWLSAAFNDRHWKKPFLLGDYSATPWSNQADMAEFMLSKEELKQYRLNDKLATQIDDAKLRREPPVKVKIVYKNQLPFIEINGKPYPPIYQASGMMGVVTTDDMIRKFYLAGIRIFRIGITMDSVGGFDKYDFSAINWRVRRLLNLAPEAYFFFSFRFGHNGTWPNADERIGYANPAVKGFDVLMGAPKYLSPASDTAWHYSGLFVHRLSEFIKKQSWNNRFIGLNINYMTDGYYPGNYYAMPDTGKAMTGKFRTFLKKKYKTDAALQKAWNDRKVTIAAAKVPNMKERFGQGFFLKDPTDPLDCRVRDYYICHSDVFAGFMANMLVVFKKHFPDRIGGMYQGYNFLNYNPLGSNSWVEELLKGKAVDFMACTSIKNKTGGYVTYQNRHLTSRFHRFGKMSISEADVRTHLKLRSSRGAETKTAQETDALLKEIFGNTIFDGAGLHFVFFNSNKEHNWFNSPEILTLIRRYLQLFKEMSQKKMAPQTEAVIIYNPDEKNLNGYPRRGAQYDGISQAMFYGLPKAITMAGSPMDFMHYRDFLESKNNYKLAVFVNIFNMTDAERKLIRKKLDRKGTTALWIYAPGIISEKGFSNAAMEELTGMKLVWGKWNKFLRLKLNNGKMVSLPWRFKENMRVYCADPQAKVLGRFIDGKAAYAEKILPSGMRSVFIAVPPQTVELWEAIFKDAGVHRYVKGPVFTRVSADKLMIHLPRAGKYPVTLPRKAKVLKDLYSNKVLFRNVKNFTLDVKQAETFFIDIKY